jgi:ubiquinone/menaquinone biosynthesis C-methylase UbiE
MTGMDFSIPGADYDRFMGRYSTRLAPLFADFAGITQGMRVLDVGCGPGALTGELLRRVGAADVAGIEPSPSFFETSRERFPESDIRNGSAETLPWPDQRFDAALSQLVLSFVTDADHVAGEMRRVVRQGGTLAACMWLEGPGMEMGHVFWEAAASLDPALAHRAGSPFRKRGEIAALWQRAGLREIAETVLEVRVAYRDFDDFWQPMLHAAGSLGTYVKSISDERRAAIRDVCHERLGRPTDTFELSGRACAARGRV